MNKKWIIALLILVAVGVIAFLFWPKAELPEPKVELPEIKIADRTLLGFIAAETGFFEKEGLRVKWEKVLPEDGLSALLAGEVDYATSYVTLSPGPNIEASLRSAPLKTIISTARYTVFYLVAQPELELNNLKTMGTLSRHTPLHYQVLRFIEKNNLEAEIIAPPVNGLKDLLLLGEVDAIFAPTSLGLQLQAQGFPILDTLVDESPLSLVARDDKIAQEPEEVQKVVQAIERAMEFIVTRPEETKELLLRFWDLEKTEENLIMVSEYYPLFKTSFDRRGVPYDEGAKLLIQIVKAGKFETLEEVEKQIVTQEEFNKVFDFRFVK